MICSRSSGPVGDFARPCEFSQSRLASLFLILMPIENSYPSRSYEYGYDADYPASFFGGEVRSVFKAQAKQAQGEEQSGCNAAASGDRPGHNAALYAEHHNQSI